MKTMILSTALLVSSLSASEAATFYYNMTLRYDGMVFKDTLVTRETKDGPHAVKTETLHEGNLSADQNLWSLKTSLAQRATGTTTNFWLSVEIPDQYANEPSGSWPSPSPASISSCYFGWIACQGGTVSALAPLSLIWSDNAFLETGSAIGETLSYHYHEAYRGIHNQYYVADEMAYYSTYYDGVEARFTILDITSYAELAPVPLPASAALLIAGIGGLAAMRRRKS